jgi:4-hydroxy-2-oxoglutarate aldolase
MSYVKLHGIFPPIVTPFNHKGDLWEVKVRHNVEKWNLTGLSGYVVSTLTGENVFLTSEEKIRMWEWVAEYSAPEKLLIAGTGMESVRETVTLTNQAAELGYRVAMVGTPHFYKHLLDNSPAQMLYFRAVADQAKIPIMICNSPRTTGIDLAADAVAALSHHQNIIAIADGSSDVERVKQMIRDAKPGFQVLNASAETLASSLAAGAVGGVDALANAIPYAVISIWEAHRTREADAALDWQNRIARANKLVSKHGAPALKHAMDLNGYYGGPPRLPLTTVTPEIRQQIEQAFDGISG